MNDEQEHSQPRMLTMHKRTITMSDGKRQMTFYTFDESNSPSYEAKRNRRGLGGGSGETGTNPGNTTPQPPPLAEEGE
jgi:hypothetical protein